MRADHFPAAIGYWLSEVRDWTCTCGHEERACARCLIHDALYAAADCALVGDWKGTYEAIGRAARIDARFQTLAGEVLESADEAQPPFACGLTSAEHAEIVADAIRREAELDKIGEQHDDHLGIHLALGNHPGCGSTLAWPLAGHRLGAP